MSSDEHAVLLAVAVDALANGFELWELFEVIRAAARQSGIDCSKAAALAIARTAAGPR